MVIKPTSIIRRAATQVDGLQVLGGCYHVILRGNHSRDALFATAVDRHALNRIVAEVIEHSGARIHAFCWMFNHVHALLQIAERP